MNTTLRTAARYLPDPTTTLAMGWIGLTVYERLWATTLRIHSDWWPWTSAVLILTVAWSVLSRKRWGRLALLGIAIATGCGGAAHLVGDHLHWPPAALERVSGVLLAPIPGAADHYDALSALFFTIAVGTIVWFLQPAVRTEFEARKAPSTSGFQRGIATFLVGCWVCAELLGGPTPGSLGGPAMRNAHQPASHVFQSNGRVRMVQRNSGASRRMVD